MSEIHKLESEIIQIEEVLFVLDNDLERVRIDNLHTERLMKLINQNINVLKSPNIVTSLDTYRKAKLELKFLQDKFLANTKLESEIDRKIITLEKEIFKKENKKIELLNKISIDKVLEFRRKQ